MTAPQKFVFLLYNNQRSKSDWINFSSLGCPLLVENNSVTVHGFGYNSEIGSKSASNILSAL